MSEVNAPDPQVADNQEARPDWLPEKFAEPAQLAKSYRELESKLGELSERAKQADLLEANYGELAARLEQVESQRAQAQGNEAAAPLINAYAQAMETGDYAQALAIQAQVSQMAAQGVVQQALPQVQKQYQTLADSQANEIGAYAARTLEQKYGDSFEQAKEQIGQILQANPHLIPEEAKYDPNIAINALDNVYKLATYGSAPAQQESSAAQLAQMKQLAQTASGSGGRVLSPDEAKQEWDAIKSAAERPYWAGLGT